MKSSSAVAIATGVTVLESEGPACEGCDGSGIRCPASPSCVLPHEQFRNWTIVERCDTCQLYPDDASAAATLFGEVRWIECASGGQHVVARGQRGLAPP